MSDSFICYYVWSSVEDSLGKENIIMPLSENDYLENKATGKVTEL